MADTIVQTTGDRLPAAVAHEALVIGDLVLLNGDGEWAKADANGTGLYPALGIVTYGASAGAYPEVCRWALLSDADWALTVGGAVFLSNTAGAFGQESATAYAGNPGTFNPVCYQLVGYAVSATRVYLNPMGSYVHP